jgi:SAM-dependent methyltransferase
MKYDNSTYWTEIHRKYEGKLKAVGHPSLSEHLNRLKYESEANTILNLLNKVGQIFHDRGIGSLSVLDVGAGMGYWSEVVYGAFIEQGFRVSVTALDLSHTALSILQGRNPQMRTIQEDLKSINPDQYGQTFDLVISCYCLHHLVNVDDFVNGLRFSGRSVKDGGFLVIMDPILTLPYSRFDVIAFAAYRGNGIPRHLYLIEDILEKEGFRKEAINPAVSFILNGNIEGYDPLSYATVDMIWRGLGILYRSDRFVRLFSWFLVRSDEILKRLRLAFSSSACVYMRSVSTSNGRQMAAKQPLP